MGTKDVESQIKFLKEDLDFLLLNPEAAGYAKIPYDSRKRRLELAQRIKSLVDYLQYRLVTEHGCRCSTLLRPIPGAFAAITRACRAGVSRCESRCVSRCVSRGRVMGASGARGITRADHGG